MRTTISCCLLAIALFTGPALAGDMDPDTLRVAEMWEISGLDPAKEGTFVKEKAMIAETLVDVDPDFSLKPGLALSWTMVSDTVWEFELRPGVLFHNGEALTAALVAQALNRAMEVNPTLAEMTRIASIEAVGDLSLRIETQGLYLPLPATLVYSDTAIVHPDSPANDQGIITAPIGTGPYMLMEWKEARHEVELRRFDGYWGQVPAIATVLYRSIPDPATRSLEIQKGTIDFLADAPYGDLDMLRSQGLNVIIASTARVHQFNFGSLEATPCGDERVRQALSLALNREDIVQFILFGMGKPAAGPFESSMVFANADLSPLACNPDRARALLAEAGWSDSDGDGVLDKDGTPFAFTLFTYPQRPGLKPMAQAMQQMWSELGLGVDVRVMDWSAILEAMQPGDIRLTANASAMIPDPDYYLRAMYSSDGSNNSWGYGNQEVDTLLEQAMIERDPEKRMECYRQIQAIVYEEQPIVHVAYYGVNIVTKPQVKNFVFNPVAHDYMLNTSMFIEQ